MTNDDLKLTTHHKIVLGWYDPSKENIVHLGIKTAIAEVEKAEKKVFSRSGVWNDYSLTTKERAISAIEKCGYGADIYIDEEKNIYVSMPCQSDMW